MSLVTIRNRAGDRRRCGVLPGAVAPGDRVAIVGAGPVGLAALQTAALMAPAAIFVLDISDARLQVPVLLTVAYSRSSQVGLV